jgi:hypothetical protein
MKPRIPRSPRKLVAASTGSAALLMLLFVAPEAARAQGLQRPVAEANDFEAPEAQSSPWVTDPWALELHAGLGTPVGYLGVALDYSPLRWLSIDAGVGIGSGREGGSAHAALGARARLLRLGERRIYAGVDYSTGGWVATSLDPVGGLAPRHGGSEDSRVVYAKRLHWVQPAVGIEQRFASGALLRLYAGMAVLMNPDGLRCEWRSGARCEVDREDRQIHRTFPFVGGAFGASF